MSGLLRPDPKPAPREKKKPRGLRRSGRIGPKTFEEAREKMRARSRRPKRKTKHARRPRARGKMAHVAGHPCDVPAAFFAMFKAEADLLRLAVGGAADEALVSLWNGDGPGPCSGHVQVMHLRREPSQLRAGEDRIAPGCVKHHLEIDGKVGGRGKWYVKLGRLGQLAFKNVITARANERWDALTPAERARFDEIAGSRRFWRRE